MVLNEGISERGMYDLNLALDHLMTRLNTTFPSLTIETRKSYRAVPAQDFEMLAFAVEDLVVSAAQLARAKKVRLENGFSAIGEGFSGLMSDASASYAYIAADLQFEEDLSGPLLPFSQQGTSAFRILSSLAERTGGFLQVETASSDTLRFTLRLPIAVVEAWQISTGVTGKRETILLVEDEEFVRNVTQEVLEMEGYKVLCVANGAEAIDCLTKHPMAVDLLLTDVVMPGMNGRDLAARLALMQPRMKVIFMSGYTDNSVLRNSVAESSTPYLQKPFTLDALLAKVHESLDVFSLAALAQRTALGNLAGER
jgi:CheY-like chemotaxis protein